MSSPLPIGHARDPRSVSWAQGTAPNAATAPNLIENVARPAIPLPDLSTLRNPRLRDDIRNLQYNIRVVNDCIAQATVLTGELSAFRDDLNSEETEGKERWEALCKRYTELQRKVLEFQRGPKFHASAAVKTLPLGNEIDGSQANKLFKGALKKLEDRNKDILVKINEWVHKKALQFPILPSSEEESKKNFLTYGLAFSGASLLSALCLNPVVAPALRDVSLGILNSQLLQDHILKSSYPSYTLGALAMAYPTYLGTAKLANFAKSWIGPTLSAIASSIKSPISKTLALSTKYPLAATLLTYGTVRYISPLLTPHLAPHIAPPMIPYLSTFAFQMISSAALISLANGCHACFFANNPSEPESAPLRPAQQIAAPPEQRAAVPVPPPSNFGFGAASSSSQSSSSAPSSNSRPSSGSSSSASAATASSSQSSSFASSSNSRPSSSGSSSSTSTAAAASSSQSSGSGSSSNSTSSSSGSSSSASAAAASSSQSSSSASSSSSAPPKQTPLQKLSKQLGKSEKVLKKLRGQQTRTLRSTAGG